MKKGNYILWLPSWYPNKYAPYNGDFIQRHARAASAFVPITVFHFVQEGGAENQTLKSEDVQTYGNLTEVIFYHEHTPVGIHAIDKLLFNLRFYQQAKQRLERHFEAFGLPLGVHVHVPVKGGNLAIWIEKEWGIPFLLSEHFAGYEPGILDNFFVRDWLYKRQVFRIFKKAKVVTNVSNYLNNILIEIFSLRTTEIIRNAVDTEIFHYPEKSSSKEFVFIHVSSLDERKNIIGILNAFSRVLKSGQHCYLVIVGPVSTKIKIEIHKLGLNENVRLTGILTYKDVAAEMKRANAFILFSKQENFPCVIIEALCCGLPVVASNVAGIPEAVNNRNGLLVPKEDIIQLGNALERVIMEYDQFDRTAISKAAQAQYNYSIIGTHFFGIYKEYFGNLK